MVAPVFTGEELQSLRRFPETGREELLLRTNIGNSDLRRCRRGPSSLTGRISGQTIIRVRP